MKKELKKPKINDLINFITSGKNENLDKSILPESFLFYEKEIKNLVPYLFEWFWSQPKFISYLNQFNNLFDNSIQTNPLEYLLFLRKLCTDNKISKYQLKNSFFNYYQALNKIKDIEKEALKQKRQFIDYYTELKIKQFLGKETEIKKAKKLGNDKEKKETIKKLLQESIAPKTKKNNFFLNELNPEIIEENQLTLFDVFLDENNNQLIYIFIDKFFQKKYFVEPYQIEILVSKDTSFIQNDYFKEIDNSFIKYKILNIWNFRNLKKAIDFNFKQQKNFK